MKIFKSTLLTLALFGLSFHTNAQQVSRCEASPIPIEIKQADGSALSIIGKGNSLVSYTETVDGYTITKNENGIYEYAYKEANGNLLPSGVKARNENQRANAENQFCSKTEKHLRYSKEYADLIKKEIVGKSSFQKSADGVFPSKGNRKVLMLLIQYPDLMATNTLNEFKSLMNTKPDSFKNFYLKSSFNQLNLTTDVFGWYTAANNYNYYGRQNGYDRARELGAEALDAAEAAGVDFSQYDNDGDGNVDGIIFVHAGLGAEQGSQNQYIWSHRSSLSAYARSYDGVAINEYMFNPERRTWGMTGIGVYCHEFGHGLGITDLYDTDASNGDSEGIGEWSIMAGGGWLSYENLPAGFDPWCKATLQWQTPTVISTNGTYSLNPAATENKSYKILIPNSTEYFLLENRQKADLDAGIPGHGLAIFHINPNKTVNSDENDKMIDLEEADGLFDLDNSVNRGDQGDLYPGTSTNRKFDNTSTPNSRTNGGVASNINVNTITETGNVVTFNLGVVKSYCTPTMTTGTNDDDFIDGVALNGMTNLATGSKGGPSYTNYPAKKATLEQSKAYSLAITSGNYAPDNYVAWIDYNNDSVFSASEKIGGFVSAETFKTSNINFTVPANAKVATVRMRVRCVYLKPDSADWTSLDPCLTYVWGETEDYAIQINAASGCAAPAKPGSISGTASFCKSPGNLTYTISSVSTATSYTWTVPSGATIVSGQGSTSLTVSYGSNTISGSICVKANNNCGSSDNNCLTVSTKAKPTNSNSIVGTNGPKKCQQSVNYSFPTTSGAAYTWSVPATATLVSGQGTNAITVTFGSGSAGDAIKLVLTYAANCNDTLTKSLALNYASMDSSLVMGDGAMCFYTTGKTFNATASTGATSYNWTITGPGTIASGQGTQQVKIDGNNQTGTINLCVAPMVNACTGATKKCKSITVGACTGIEDTELSKLISVYPNPGRGLFVIDLKDISETDVYEVKIFNTLGQLVRQQKLSTDANNRLTLDISDESKGLYSVHLSIGDQNVVKSIILE